MSAAQKAPRYHVMRDCCTSGNCFLCTRTRPYGTCIRVEQFITTDKAKAEEVKHNWRGHKASIITQ